MSWENPVKKRWREGKPAFGVTISSTSVDAAAHLAEAGFDFLWIEMEHSPITLETLRNIVLATHGRPAAPFARVPVNETWMAKRVLDAGVAGVIFPFTSTPELAAQAAAACRYPPLGCRGSGATLARLCWPEPERYHDSADENVVVIAMIEEARALDCIDEIATTPGVDALFVGTSDLAFSMGLRGDQAHPRVEEAVGKVLAACQRHGKVAGRPAIVPEKVAEFVGQGYLLFQAPTDLGFMVSAAKQYLDSVRGNR